jgi:integrase
MTPDKHALEPIDPRTAQQLFLDHKETECAEATVQSYRYRTNYFVEWCERNDLENLNDLSGRDIHTFRLWRQESGDLKPISMKMQMTSLRVFLKWAGTIEAVPENLYDKVLIPSVTQEESRRDETLGADRAEDLLDYLSTYQYASTEHTLLALLWQTGIRIGAARALDVEDVDFESGHLVLRNRPDEGTRLKNGDGGERLVALTAELMTVLGDYIDECRIELEDDYGREPLLTTRQYRMSRATMRRIIYRVTAPCFLDEPCPECHPESERRCGDAVSPHAIRRGSITHYLSQDVPVDVISERMNVGRKTLETHYDKRSEEVKVEQRRDHLQKI